MIYINNENKHFLPLNVTEDRWQSKNRHCNFKITDGFTIKTT